jgi:hypothetical protein
LQVAASVFDRLVRDDVKALQGQFVVEIGVRQAWPFLTLCDNAPTPARETRLYIGTSFRAGSSPQTFADGDPHPAVAQLLQLNNRTVTDVALSADNELLSRLRRGPRDDDRRRRTARLHRRHLVACGGAHMTAASRLHAMVAA